MLQQLLFSSNYNHQNLWGFVAIARLKPLSRQAPIFILKNMEYTHKEILSLKYGTVDFGCIYAIKNIKTNKYYIGQTQSFFKRSKSHINSAINNRGLFIDLELGKNIDDFIFIVILPYSEFDARRRVRSIKENEFISHYGSVHPNGYNIKHYENLSIYG